MNIGKRLRYLIHTYNKTEPDFKEGPVLAAEWSAILERKLPLRYEIASILANNWNVPIGYLTSYEQNDLSIHRELQALQHELLTNDSHAEERINKLDQPMSIHSIVQEVIFHLLKSVYHYKRNELAIASEIEQEYLSLMLPDYTIWKETIAFQRAFFYYFGVKYFYEGKTAESLQYFERLLEKTSDTDEVVSVMQNLALISKNTKEYDQSIVYMRDLAQYSRKHNHQRGLSIALNYLGVLHLLKESYPTSIYYFEKLNEMELDPLMQSRLYHNLGVLYGKQERFEEAIAMYEQAVVWRKAYNIEEEMFLSCHALARNHHLNGDEEKAHYYLNLANHQADNEEERMLAKMIEAQMQEDKHPEEAIRMYETIATCGIATILDDIYPVLIRLYTRIGQKEKASLYSRRYKELHIKMRKEKEA
ncbi:tetratricopeptide repeat protein [Thalassobacillus pellis]|uniref:tetratricopeptide repeat protein n=1 Tax=Thalassobacillus pellis TaxID=748008 RepID=UPI001960104E|nr:tetratricopeptide repeat protein [Thalassobacillus pellis]MBM7551710.1 tetratricopeptide (TPR) repeat protein [Thalassobacillus pellis]